MSWYGWGKGFDHAGAARGWQAGPAVSLKQEVEDLKKVLYGKGTAKGKGKSDGSEHAWGAWKGKAKGKGKGKEEAPKGKGKEAKGEAKGKGKTGKGKGKGSCWPCPEQRCADMVGKVWMNPDSLDQCSQCHTWKVTKVDPSVVWQARREELRAEILAEGEAAAPAGDEEDMEISEEEEEEEDILWTTEEYKELEEKLQMPKDLKPGWDPEREVELGVACPGVAAAQRDKEIQACKKHLDLVPMAATLGLSKDDFAKTRTKLAALEKSAAKAERDAPGAKLTACQLTTARQLYTDAEEKKRKFATAGEEKAVKNQERMEEICQEQAEAWMDEMRRIQKSAKERVEAWNERKAELEDRTAQVLKVVDSRIAAANTLANSLKSQGAAAAETADEKKEREEEEAKDKAAKEGKAKAEAEKAAAAKAEADRQAAARAEAKKAFARLQTTATITITATNLVDVSKLKSSKESTKVMATMYYWARASAMGDQALPFSFAEMGATVVVARELVGETGWKAFFSDCKVGDTDVCPMQLRQIMFLQLMTLDASLREKVNADQEAVALKHLEDAEPRLKRLRVMLTQA